MLCARKESWSKFRKCEVNSYRRQSKETSCAKVVRRPRTDQCEIISHRVHNYANSTKTRRAKPQWHVIIPCKRRTLKVEQHAQLLAIESTISRTWKSLHHSTKPLILHMFAAAIAHNNFHSKLKIALALSWDIFYPERRMWKWLLKTKTRCVTLWAYIACHLNQSRHCTLVLSLWERQTYHGQVCCSVSSWWQHESIVVKSSVQPIPADLTCVFYVESKKPVAVAVVVGLVRLIGSFLHLRRCWERRLFCDVDILGKPQYLEKTITHGVFSCPVMCFHRNLSCKMSACKMPCFSVDSRGCADCLQGISIQVIRQDEI